MMLYKSREIYTLSFKIHHATYFNLIMLDHTKSNLYYSHVLIIITVSFFFFFEKCFLRIYKKSHYVVLRKTQWNQNITKFK